MPEQPASPSPVDVEIRAITDRLAVVEVLHRFAAGLDRRDWALYRSVFTDEIELDYSSYRPTNIGTWRADDWVARARQVFPGLDATAHSVTNAIVELDGDTARISAYVRADHALVEPSTDGDPAGARTRVYTVCGRYEDRLVRTADGWKIAAKALHVGWVEGDPEVMAVARERAAARPA